MIAIWSPDSFPDDSNVLESTPNTLLRKGPILVTFDGVTRGQIWKCPQHSRVWCLKSPFWLPVSNPGSVFKFGCRRWKRPSEISNYAASAPSRRHADRRCRHKSLSLQSKVHFSAPSERANERDQNLYFIIAARRSPFYSAGANFCSARCDISKAPPAAQYKWNCWLAIAGGAPRRAASSSSKAADIFAQAAATAIMCLWNSRAAERAQKKHTLCTSSDLDFVSREIAAQLCRCVSCRDQATPN